MKVLMIRLILSFVLSLSFCTISFAAPSVSVYPENAPQGSTFSEPGSGFTPNGTATLYFSGPDGDAVPVTDKGIDEFGSYLHNWTCVACPVGPYSYYAIDDTTQQQSPTVYFNVTLVDPQVSVTPTNGMQGTTFSEPGSGFTPNSTATLYFSGPDGDGIPVSRNTNEIGSYTHSWTCDECPIGQYSYYAVDDTTQQQSPIVNFNVILVAPQVSVTPSIGIQGTTFSEPGSGFTPDSTATLYFSGPDGDGDPVTRDTDSNGSYYHSWMCDECPIGQYNYYAIDSSTGQHSNTASFEVLNSSQIAGTISLPSGTAPAGGVDVYIHAYDDNDDSYNYSYGSWITIPEGSSSISYSVALPDGTGPLWRISYHYSNNNDYVHTGYYSSTETTCDWGNATLLAGGQDYSNIDMTLVPANTISGTVLLPSGTAPADGVSFYVYAFDANSNGSSISSNWVTIPEGSSSAMYSIAVPDYATASWRITYRCDDDDYVSTGYYTASGTTWTMNAGTLLSGGQNHPNIDLTLLTGTTISGNISLPSGTAPAGGTPLYIQASDGSEYFNKYVVIPSGSSSASYFITIPNEATISWRIKCYDTNSDYLDGYYTSSGTTWEQSSATWLSGGQPHTNINLTLLTGQKITGTISLSAGTAPAGGINNISIGVLDNNYRWNSSENVSIPAGSSSAIYSITVPDDSSLSWGVSYSYSGDSSFLSSGYYASTETVSERSSATLLPGGQAHTDINLTLLTGNTITGTVSLPSGVTAPAGGINDIQVTISNSNGSGYFFTHVSIPAGSSSATYSIEAPDETTASWQISYHYYATDYIQEAYYASTETTWDTNASTLLAGGQDHSNINLTLLTGVTITGTVSLPSGTAPEYGTAVTVVVNSLSGGISLWNHVNIPSGSSSATYSITVPGDTTLSFYVSYSWAPSNYLENGYYSSTGTTWDWDAKTLLPGGQDHTDINLTLLTGSTITGTIALPPGTIATDNIFLDICANDPNGSGWFCGDTGISAGSSSSSYSLTVPPDPAALWTIHYSYWDGDYIQAGYYAATGTTWNKDTATTLPGGQDHSDIDLTLLTGTTISGTLSLPDGREATATTYVTISVYEVSSGVQYFAYSTIPAGSSSTTYSITVPDDTGTSYRINYGFSQTNDYFPTGYYASAETTVDVSEATLLAGGQDHLDIDLSLLVDDTPFFVPLFRGYSSTDNDHFYTTNPTERDAMPANNYTYEKIEGFISNRPFDGGVPLYRFYNGTTKNHYYTTTDTNLDPSWEDEGIAGYVYPVPADNMVPMYHLESTVNDDHFYTISEFERDYAVNECSYQNWGVAFYVARNSSASALAGKPVARNGGVDLSSGNFAPYRNHIDLANPLSVGLPFVFSRTYNSNNVGETGPLGSGWNHSYNIRIEESASEAIVQWGNGQNDAYTINASTDTYEKPPGVFNTLEKTDSYILTTKNNTVYTFSSILTEEPSIYRLINIRDKNGINLALYYDPALLGTPRKGVLTHIEDGAGRVYRFDYHVFGNLSESNRCRLISIEEEDAGSLTRNIAFNYDNQGRLTSYTDPANNTTTYAYEDPNIPDLLTKITLPEGNQITAEYTGDKIDRIQIGSQKVITIEYDRYIKKIDGVNIYGTIYTIHSSTGPDQVIKAVHGDSSDTKLNMLMDSQGNTLEVVGYEQLNPTHIIDQNGNPLHFEYHPETGNITKSWNSYLQTTHYEYDPAKPNNLLTLTDPEGNITRFEYDAKDNVEKITQVIGGVDRDTIISRYPNGQVHTVTTPSNNSAGSTASVIYTYDSYGYPSTVTDALGNVTHFTYDPGGRLVAQEDADHVTATYVYDQLGNVLTAKDVLDRTTDYQYDGNGNLTKVTDPLSIITDYTYTDLDLVETVTRAGVRIAKYGYEETGRKTSTVNSADRSWDVAYDEAGNILSSSTPMGYTDLFDEYYPNGSLKQQTDRTGRQTTYSYDEAGRLVAKSIASGHLYGYEYYANNRLKAISRNNSPIGHFLYDARGNLTSYTDPYDQTVGYSYYPGGNLEKITYPGGKEVTYNYDARNLLTSVTDWLSRETTYDYTDGGRLRKITYPNGTYIDYLYDAAFRLQTVSNKLANGTVIVEYTVDSFDDLDAPLQVTTTGGIPASVSPMSESYSNDNNNRTTDAGTATFTYNNQGEVLTRNDGGENTIFTWHEDDVAGRLQSVSIDGAVKSFEYDGLGNRVSRTVNGSTTRYVLDVSGKLANVLMETDQSGTPSTYYIHGLGLTARILPDNSTRYYHYDRRGNVVALTDDSGNVTDQYSYDPDPYGFGIARQGSTDNPFTFVGRYGVMGDGDDLFYMRARYYDAKVGKFLSEDPIGFAGGDLNLYAYVGGNPVVGVDPSGLAMTENEKKQFTQSVIDNGITYLEKGLTGVSVNAGTAVIASIAANKFSQNGYYEEAEALIAVVDMMSVSATSEEIQAAEAKLQLALDKWAFDPLRELAEGSSQALMNPSPTCEDKKKDYQEQSWLNPFAKIGDWMDWAGSCDFGLRL